MIKFFIKIVISVLAFDPVLGPTIEI